MSFRGQKTAAPLKLTPFSRIPILAPGFRGQKTAAPLKQTPPLKFYPLFHCFRGQKTAAPLKQCELPGGWRTADTFPRSKDRGPIEAAHRVRRLLAKLRFRGQKTAAPLKIPNLT